MITTQCLLCGTKGIISSKKLADFLARSKHKSNGYWLVDCDWLNNVLKMILLYLRKPRCILASPYLFSISWGSKASDIKATMKLKMAGCTDLEQIGRASCRERVQISVVAGSLKKKKQKQTWHHLSQSYSRIFTQQIGLAFAKHTQGTSTRLTQHERTESLDSRPDYGTSQLMCHRLTI